MAPTSDPSLNLTIAYSSIPTHEVILDYGDALNKTCRPPENREILVHYPVLDKVWNRNEMIVDDTFTYSVATDIMLSDDIEPYSVDKCRRRTDWSNWKQAIHVNMQLIDMVTAYLYEDLDREIYMKVPERLPLTGSNNFRSQNTLLIRLRRSLYKLKQSGQM
ncbi:hypothetical protein ACFX1Z_004045 [Malus domestica]